MQLKKKGVGKNWQYGSRSKRKIEENYGEFINCRCRNKSDYDFGQIVQKVKRIIFSSG